MDVQLEIRFMERGICPVASPPQTAPIIYNKGYIAYFALRMRETAIFPLPV